MFENYQSAKKRKRNKWAFAFLIASITIHAIALLVLLIRSFWVVDPLGLPKHGIQIAVAAPPPPPPPPPPAGKKKSKKTNTTKKKIMPKVPVQPPKEVIDEEPAEDDGTEDEGEEGGVEGGVVGGVAGGVLGGTLGGVLESPLGDSGPPPPPPPAAEPIFEPPSVMAKRRISGETEISPENNDKIAMKQAGKNQLVAVVNYCITAGGTVRSAKIVASSKYPNYDQKLLSAVRRWKFSPTLADGKPIPVCSNARFIYKQSN